MALFDPNSEDLVDLSADEIFQLKANALVFKVNYLMQLINTYELVELYNKDGSTLEVTKNKLGHYSYVISNPVTGLHSSVTHDNEQFMCILLRALLITGFKGMGV
jgi:hypothetical protein